MRLEEVFDSIDTRPVASGSIGQIHRATLSRKGAAVTGCRHGQVVAVKVSGQGGRGGTSGGGGVLWRIYGGVGGLYTPLWRIGSFETCLSLGVVSASLWSLAFLTLADQS